MENNEGLGSGRAGFKAHCPHCRREEDFIHARLSCRRHLLLTILTAGLWSVVWAALLLGKCLRPWRCSICGWHKPEFRKTVQVPVPRNPNNPRKKVQPPTVE
jgi:hypothetical protein